MSALSNPAGLPAIKATSTNESSLPATVIPESESNEWFSGPARQLLPSDTGFALHIISGFPESTCYRYARGGTQPTTFYRRLLFHPQGATWLNVLMDGCNQQWWRDHQRAVRIIAKVDAAYRE